MKEKFILSMGAGINSTALLFWLIKNKKPLDEVVFADPKNEMPETYDNIERLKQWCEKHDVKFTIVTSHLSRGDLKAWYISKKMIPVRLIRSCTDLFTIRPIYKYLESKYGKQHFNVYIGIASDEAHRAKESGRQDRTMLYPLVENGIDREGCIKIIKAEKFTVPVKSGCYFCPFQSKANWNMLLLQHPELYDKAMEFEENCKRFPEFYLGRVPLRQFKKAIKEQKNLSRFTDYGEVQKCLYCHT